MDRCPNCHEVRSICMCTWDEQFKALRILKQREKERRKKLGKKTVIEEEEEKIRELFYVNQ